MMKKKITAIKDDDAKAISHNNSYQQAYRPSHIMQNSSFFALLSARFFSSLPFYSIIIATLLLLSNVEKGQKNLYLTFISFIVFFVPFLIFSAIAGQYADNFDKTHLVRLLKFINIIVILFAVFAFITSFWPFIFIALFLMGTVSALSDPIEKSILPEKFFNKQSLIANISVMPLHSANAGLLVTGFIALFVAAVLLTKSLENYRAFFAFLMVVFAIFAWLACRFIDKKILKIGKIPIDYNIIRASYQQIRLLWQSKMQAMASLILAWFYLVTLVFLFFVLTKSSSITNFSYGNLVFLFVFCCFIFVGSGLAIWFSATRIAFSPIFFALIVISAALFDFSYVIYHSTAPIMVGNLAKFSNQPILLHLLVDIAFFALCLPILFVPSLSALQITDKNNKIGQVMAAKNIQTVFIIIFAISTLGALTFFGFGWPLIFAILAILTLVLAVGLFIFLPTNPLCDFAAFLYLAVFRLEYNGIENLTKAGDNPILLIPYESKLDGLLALVLCFAVGLKPPQFFIDTKLTKYWYFRPFIKLMHIYPLELNNKQTAKAMIAAQRQKKPIVILIDGRIAMTGDLMKNYENAALLIEKSKAKIIPVKIDGLEQSYFAKQQKIPLKRQLFPKIRATILEPIAYKKPSLLQDSGISLYYLMGNILFQTSYKHGNLFEELVLSAQKYGKHKAIVEDLVAGKQNYKKLLVNIRLFAKYIERKIPLDKNIAILLPNSNNTVMAFFALISAGKVPTMLNYTVGLSSLQTALQAANSKILITSKQFIERLQLQEVIKALKDNNIKIEYLENIIQSFSMEDKILAWLNFKKPIDKDISANNPAAILFTSGSEGTPKGVVLTHSNILANIVQIAARLDFIETDKVFNILPLFHSFGLTVATIMPLMNGVPVCFYPSPLRYKEVPEAIHFTKASIIFSTDTFLNGYARNAQAYDLSSIRYCIAGAEQVKSLTRDLMMQKFGIRVLEGYGVTEASPVISLSTPNYNKPGTVGKILPGIETHLEVVEGIEKGGRLFIKGPNIMAGYLTIEKANTLLPPKNGWHDTGDIVEIDENGFITILGRAKRFAKIGGEMISLSAVEKLATKLWPEISLAIVAVSDAKKGERLVLISDDEKPNRAEFLQYAKKNGVAEITIPTKFIKASLPVLATGKVDYVNLKKMAEEMS